MSRISVISLLLLLLSFSTVFALERGQGVQATLLKEKSLTDYQAIPRFAAAELCSVRTVGDQYWVISYWLTGNEQYLAYQDPGLTCSSPYPFAVHEIYLLLYVQATTNLYYSGCIQDVDLTNPACPMPGDTLSQSAEWAYGFSPGLWRIVVPAYDDTIEDPPEVNGPYFAGFTITTSLVDTEYQDSVLLITEDSLHVPWTCQNYNYYGEEDGYVDLANNVAYNFPGKLLLYSAGFTGGSGGYGPMPNLTILEPKPAKIAGTPLRCWVLDSADSSFVDSVKFEYASSSGWVRFGADVNDNHAIRNGIDPSGTGPGYVVNLGPAGIIEDEHTIRVTAYDTLFRTSVTQVDITLDPTPPRMDFIEPSFMDTICLPDIIKTFTDDDDISSVIFYQKQLKTNYSASVVTLHQTNYGDVNYFAGDDNLIINDEFGEYYCGPTAGAIAIKYWFDKGYTGLMRESGLTIPVDTVVERLASGMKTRTNKGTYDDFFVSGLENYITYHGNNLIVESYFTPDYTEMRVIFEEKEMLPILGLSGNPGFYVVLSAMSGLDNGGGQYAVTISDPLTGTSIDTYMRNIGDGSQVLYDGSWYGLDIAIAVVANNHNNSRVEIGEASMSISNWVFNWDSSTSLSDDSLYYITAIGTDVTHHKEISTTLIRYHCNLNRVEGDYDGNGSSNSLDILYLINYIYQGGSAPIGGAHRADANCDNQIDIGDVIFMVKYVFGSGSLPCY